MDPSKIQVQSRVFKWGNPAKRHVSSLLSFSVTAATGGKKHRMHILLALVYVCLVAAPGCSNAPTKGDSVRNTIHSIINIAQITLVHIKKLKLTVALRIEPSTPSIDGLTTISHELGLLDNALQSPLTEHLSQIHADVSSLEGRVRSLALTMGCPIQARPRADAGDSMFPESHLQLTLAKVQSYLEKFLVHKDKLEVC